MSEIKDPFDWQAKKQELMKVIKKCVKSEKEFVRYIKTASLPEQKKITVKTITQVSPLFWLNLVCKEGWDLDINAREYLINKALKEEGEVIAEEMCQMPNKDLVEYYYWFLRN